MLSLVKDPDSRFLKQHGAKEGHSSPKPDPPPSSCGAVDGSLGLSALVPRLESRHDRELGGAAGVWYTQNPLSEPSFPQIL